MREASTEIILFKNPMAPDSHKWKSQAEIFLALFLSLKLDAEELSELCSLSEPKGSMARICLHIAQLDDRYRLQNSETYLEIRISLLKRLGNYLKEANINISGINHSWKFQPAVH